MTQEKKHQLYEDEKIEASVPDRQFLKGHIRVQPKEVFGKLEEMDGEDFCHMIYGASFAATALFENMQAHGTNIIMNTGGPLKEREGLKIDVLARWNEDGMKLLWTPKKLTAPEMKETADKIKEKMPIKGAKKTKEVLDLDKKKTEKIEPSAKNPDKKEEKAEKKEKEETKKENKTGEEAEESYLIRQLKRMP